MRVLSINQGSAVVVQNSINKGFFYVVKSGVLAVDSEHRLQDKALSRFEPGDSFGLVSALTGHRFLVTVFAKTDAQIIEIPIKKLGSYLHQQKELAIRMMSLYTKELRAIHKYFSLINTPNETQISPANLFNDAQQYFELGKPHFASYAWSRYVSWASKQPPSKSILDKLVIAKQKLAAMKEPYQGPHWQGSTANLRVEDILFLENENSREIYVVKSGAIRLFKIIRGQELIIDVLGAGEIFGEMAFIDQAHRMASAVADKPSVVFRFTKDTLFNTVGEAILQKIFESLARRIWFSHQRLVILRIADPITRLYAFIYNLIRNHEISNEKKSQSCQFNIGLEELKKMCGLSKIKDERIETFLSDKNIVLGQGQISILDRKRIEDKVAYFKTRSGQISLNAT